MLIDEFLNFNAQQEMMETMVSNSPDEKPRKNTLTMSSSGRASPKRASFTGAQSPKAKQMSPRRGTMK